MRSVGLFEAKTKLSEICRLVAQTGQSVRITRRGRSLAIITPPLPSQGGSVWDARIRFEKENGALTEDFDLPPRKSHPRSRRNPLD